MTLRIRSRAEWGARPPRSRSTIRTPTPRLWLHHTAGSEPDGPAGLRRIQNFHMDTRRWADIAYSFVVDRQGAIFEGRGAGVSGAHTQGDNSQSHGICIIGNYQTTPPTQASLEATAALVRHGAEQGWWQRAEFTGGHRDAPGASTACPGDQLYRQISRINQMAALGVAPPGGGSWLDMATKEELRQVVEEALAAPVGDKLPGIRGALRNIHGVAARHDRRDGPIRGPLREIEIMLAELIRRENPSRGDEQVTATAAEIVNEISRRLAEGGDE